MNTTAGLYTGPVTSHQPLPRSLCENRRLAQQREAVLLAGCGWGRKMGVPVWGAGMTQQGFMRPDLCGAWQTLRGQGFLRRKVPRRYLQLIRVFHQNQQTGRPVPHTLKPSNKKCQLLFRLEKPKLSKLAVLQRVYIERGRWVKGTSCGVFFSYS